MDNQSLLNNQWVFNKQFSLTMDGRSFTVNQYIRGCLMEGTLECKLEIVE